MAPRREVPADLNTTASTLEPHGLRLDIVYDDPEYPVKGKYSQIYYWNQKS